MQLFTKALMRGMLTLEACLEQEFILLKILPKATSMSMVLVAAQVAPFTKTGLVTSAIGKLCLFLRLKAPLQRILLGIQISVGLNK